MKKTLLIILASFVLHAASADEVLSHEEDKARPDAPAAAPATAPQQPALPTQATDNAKINVTGIIFEVHCKAQVVSVTASNGQSYLVHFVSISGMPKNKMSLQDTCNKFLRNGLSVTFSGHNNSHGDITDAVLRIQ